MRSTINWRDACDLPDSDVTVLVHCPDESEPVWLGYWDGHDGVWRCIEGNVIDRPECWAELPFPAPDSRQRMVCEFADRFAVGGGRVSLLPVDKSQGGQWFLSTRDYGLLSKFEAGKEYTVDVQEIQS